MAKPILPVYDICNLSPEPGRHAEIMVDGFAHYLDTHRDLHFPHRHSFYHLVYFTGGGGRHSIDFIHFPVRAGQVYAMTPGQVHTWNFAGKMDGYIINFSSSFLSGLLSDARYADRFSFFSGRAEEQVIQLDKRERATVEALLERLRQEYGSGRDNNADLMRAMLVQLFIELERCRQPVRGKETTPYNSVLLRNFEKLVEQHYRQMKLVKEYAAMLYVTPNHLNALCKDLTGHAAGELIRNRILLEAKRLLVNADIHVAGIASELGFADNSYFSRFFKKYEGMTPDQFRKKIKDNHYDHARTKR